MVQGRYFNNRVRRSLVSARVPRFGEIEPVRFRVLLPEKECAAMSLLAPFGRSPRRKSRDCRKKQCSGRAGLPKRLRIERLEARWVLSPTFTGLPASQIVGQGQSYMFPLVGSGASDISYTAQSDNPDISASIIPGSGSGDHLLTLTVNHTSSGAGDPTITNGTMQFLLFDDVAPNTTSRI
jgi:hypothetical protein